MNYFFSIYLEGLNGGDWVDLERVWVLNMQDIAPHTRGSHEIG
jgi:hypothetical protein